MILLENDRPIITDEKEDHYSNTLLYSIIVFDLNKTKKKPDLRKIAFEMVVYIWTQESN